MYRSLLLSLLFCLAEVVEGASGDERWSSIFSAPDFGTVHTLAFMGNGDLIVGGSFARVAEELGTANIARWNGTNWSTVGGGLPGATIYAVLPYGNSVVVGGSFTSIAGQSITNIALWDGTNWNGIGGGLSGGSVRALALHNGTIVAGGLFTRAGAQAAGYIAGWDGAAWVTYGGGVQASSPSGLAVPVQALLSYNGALYAGGRFFAAGGSSASNIARWTGTAWEALGVGAENGVNDGVSTLAASEAILYIGGKFTVAGSQPASCLATWNGNAWSPFGLFADPTGPSVTSLLSLPSGELYAGGNITRVDGTNIAGLAKWDGMQWSSVAAPLRHPVGRLAHFGSRIVASALLENVVVQPGRAGLVQYDGQQWSVIGAGIVGSGGNPYIQSVKAAGDRVLVSGYFAIADGSSRRNMVAQWRGAGWTNLGNGLYTAQLSTSEYINDYLIEADAVHAAGTSFGVNIVSSLTATGGWTNFATPPDRGLAMIRYRGDLILGHLTGIALWTNSAWTNLDAGPVGAVYSLAVLNDQLYAGGLFNSVGTSVANNIARWDGTNWMPLAGGVNALVHTLAVSGDRLFAGGDFTAAGGVEALSVAQWSQKGGWAPLGAGLTGGQGTTRVYSLKATVDGRLFAGGTFTSSGSNVVSYIAMWNGEEWLSLGSGVNNHVYSVDISGADLFVGGRFTRAGNHSSLAFGRWRIPRSLGLDIAAPDSGEPFLNVTGEPGTTIVVEESSNLEAWTPVSTNSLVFESTPVSITPGFSARFYRLRLAP